MTELCVLTSAGLGGENELFDNISKNGYDVRITDAQWCRDHYVFFNDAYIAGKGGKNKKRKDNLVGFGGHVLPAENSFILIGDQIAIGLLTEIPREYADIYSAIVREVQRFYKKCRVRVLPTGYFHQTVDSSLGTLNHHRHSHIDMYTLFLPRSKILLTDVFFNKGAGLLENYEQVAHAEGLELIRFDGFTDRVWYPLNALVLPASDGSDVVVVDSEAKSLITLLNRKSIKTISVQIPQHQYPAGKIHCQTNTCRAEDVSRVLADYF